MKKTLIMPIPVRKALKKLGSDIKEARIKRRITMSIMAERVGTSRATLTRIERGDAAVSIGLYSKVLFSLGLINRLSTLVDASVDEVGLSLESENLPKRVRPSSKKSED